MMKQTHNGPQSYCYGGGCLSIILPIDCMSTDTVRDCTSTLRLIRRLADEPGNETFLIAWSISHLLQRMPG